MNEQKFSGLLGICRKAGKMSVGHDAAKISVKNKTAYLCILASDASERIKDEFAFLCKENEITLIETPFPIEQFTFIIGQKAAVLTVDDEGFGKKLLTYREDII